MTPRIGGWDGPCFAANPVRVFAPHPGTVPDPKMATALPAQDRKPLAQYRR